MIAARRYKVGDLRPSQLLYSFGIGAIIDLPRLSGLIMGLDDWDVGYAKEIGEERLLSSVRAQEGLENVNRLLAAPTPPEGEEGFVNPFDAAVVGIPVAPFPRWMLCPFCRLLAPLESGLFKLKVDRFRADRTGYVHENCPNAKKPPFAVPSRFMVACPKGHLDDFPWKLFVHKGPANCNGILRLRDSGISGEVTDVFVLCEGCGALRQMTAAFGRDGRAALPVCRARWPHLRDYDEGGCTEQLHTILLGASNSWFPLTLSALAIPTASGKLAQLVEEAWPTLKEATSPEILKAFRLIGQLPALSSYADEEIWEATEARRQAGTAQQAATGSLRAPEWEVFTNSDPARNSTDFRLKPVNPPRVCDRLISQVVLVERLRQVQALIGFTRIESPGDLADQEEFPPDRRAPLARTSPQWIPATEVRGEGIFIRFDEDAVRDWEMSAVAGARARDFAAANWQWRTMRKIDPAKGFPGIRYVLLHSFAHALMRQMVLECGYSAASVRERIYALPPEAEDGPMAGILIYTSAPDSEGTLGGLVNLGYPDTLGRHIEAALGRIEICASDPYCSEHNPAGENVTLHGAACHSCLFVPETSCERGNHFLDRSLLIETIIPQGRAFFAPQG
jgi:hypothetical protein